MRTIIIMGLLIAAQTCFSQGGKYEVLFKPSAVVEGKIQRTKTVMICKEADSLRFALSAVTDGDDFKITVCSVKGELLAERWYLMDGSPSSPPKGRLPKNKKQLDQFLLDHFGFVVRKINGENLIIKEI